MRTRHWRRPPRLRTNWSVPASRAATRDGVAASVPTIGRPRWRGLLIGLGCLWNLPNTVLGMCLGVLGCAAGARVHWRRDTWALAFGPVPWFGHGGALTLGNVILHTGESLDVACLTYAYRAGRGAEPAIRLTDHERAHVFQSMVLGPLFLPVYLLCGGVSVRNPFEQAADRYARHGRGWWPD